MAKGRRQYDAEFKFNCVLQLLSGRKSIAQLSREYNVKSSVISRWRQRFLERGQEVFEAGNGRNEEEARIAELERLVGRLTLELEATKKVSSWLNRR